MSKTYFISDLHLGARYIADRRAHEQRAVAFLDSIADDANALYLVGDILDYWFEYRTVVPRGYVRFFGALARLADRGVKVTWFIGNHDIWLFDYLRDEIGISVVDGALETEICGRTFFISHGDGLGHLGLGFRIIRAIFRNRLCQKAFSAIHPRWTVPFAYRWSSHNRTSGVTDFERYEAVCSQQVAAWAEAFLREHPQVDYFVLGHHHIVVDRLLSTGARLVILGEWLSGTTYGVFDGEKFEIRQFDTTGP